MCLLPASSQPPPLKWLNDSRGHFHTHTCCWAQNRFGEFQAVSLPEAITAIFHSPSAAHQCETRAVLLSADASAVLLFDQGFVRHILLVSPGAVGMNEKRACEKVGSQMEKEKRKERKQQKARIFLCSVGQSDILWDLECFRELFMHGWWQPRRLLVQPFAIRTLNSSNVHCSYNRKNNLFYFQLNSE